MFAHVIARAPRLCLLAFALAACVPGTEGGSTQATPETCAALGGRFEVLIGSGQGFCNLPTADAGAACTTSADCDAYCLAETRQCSPYRSLGSGCHAWIEPDGSIVRLCSD